MNEIATPLPKHISILELTKKWNCSLEQIMDQVLAGDIIVYCWIKAVDGSVPESKQHFLCPLPTVRIQESFDLTPNHSLADRKIGFLPINRLEPSELPFEVAIDYSEFDCDFRLRETALVDLLIKFEDVLELEENTKNGDVSSPQDLIVIDISGQHVLYEEKKFDFTKHQMKFLKVLFERKRQYIDNKFETPYLRGSEVLSQISKIEDNEKDPLTSKRVADLFQGQYRESFHAITVENQERKKGIYEIKGSKVKIT